MMLLVIVTAAACERAACAQGLAEGALRGYVMLPRGKGAAGATVWIQGDNQPAPVRVFTDRQGRFRLLHQPPGDYRLAAILPGFEHVFPPVLAQVRVGGGEVADVTLGFYEEPRSALTEDRIAMVRAPPVEGVQHLGVAASEPGISRSMFLAAGTPALPVSPAVPASLLVPEGTELTLTDTAANDATLAGASPAADASSADAQTEEPAATREESDLGAAAVGPSYGGLSPTENTTRLDGLSADQNFRAGPRGVAAGGPRTSATFGQMAVRQFPVMPRTFSAQWGSAGGVILALSAQRRPGPLHGTVFGYVRESAWAATNPFSLAQGYRDGVVTSGLVKPASRTVDVGAAVGAALPLPWRRSAEAGLFASAEVQLRNNPAVASPASAGFYSLTPTQWALLGNRGVSVAATRTALNFLGTLSGAVPRTDLRLLGSGRIDVPLGARDEVGVAAQRNHFDSPAGNGYGSSDAVVNRGRGSLGDTFVEIAAYAGHWDHAFGQRARHALRRRWVHDQEYGGPHAPVAGEPAIGPGGFAPEVDIAPNGFLYGTPASLGRTAYPDERRVEMANALTVTTTQHVVTLGADWSRLDDDIASLTNGEGTFLYESGFGKGYAGGLVDWISDYIYGANSSPNGSCPSIYNTLHYFCFHTFSQSFGGTDTHFVTHDVAAFVQDAYRPTRSLSVTIGLRYDYTLLPIPPTPNYTLDAVLATWTGMTSGLTSVYPEDRNNFGPRLALSWIPGRRSSLVVHAGYGLFFGRLPGATLRAAIANTALAGTTRTIRITPKTETLCPQVPNQGFGYPCDYTAPPPSAVLSTTAATLFSDHFRMPAIQRGTFTTEFAAGRHLFLQTGYEIAVATQLPNSVDVNIAPSTSMVSYVLQGTSGYPGLAEGETFQVPLYTARRSLNYGAVSALISDVNATYHAATIEARVRGPGTLQLRGSFTYSRAIDYGPQLGATPRLSGRFDPFVNGYDKGLSSLQFPERFSGDLLFRTSLGYGPELVRRAASGWRLSFLANAGSGAPYSYGVYGGTYLAGGHTSLNGSGGATWLPTVGRNTLQLPVRSHVDARVERELRLGQRWRLQGFAQAFNVLNTRNLSRVETRAFLLGTPASTGAPTPLILQTPAALAAEGLSTPAFGQPLSSTAGLSRERQVEFGARLSF